MSLMADLLQDAARAKAAKDKPKAPGGGMGFSVPSKPVEQPSALVLCTVLTTCLNCGAQYKTPSRNLLLRFGRDYSRTLKSLVLFKDVPREHITKSETAPYCHECIGVSPTTHFD